MGGAGLDRERLDALLAPVARAHGAEIVDVELKNESGGWVLRIFVEKAGSAEKNATIHDAAIDLEMCANVARDVSPALDVVDLVPHRYHLEVSSPGVERPLKTARDFVRFSGQKAKIKLRAPLRGQHVIVGQIASVEEGKISLTDGRQTYDFALHDVSTARLVFEFGPAPKPGKHPAQARSKSRQVRK